MSVRQFSFTFSYFRSVDAEQIMTVLHISSATGQWHPFVNIAKCHVRISMHIIPNLHAERIVMVSGVNLFVGKKLLLELDLWPANGQ